MAPSLPTSEPLVVRAGESWAWARTDLAEHYPASDWSLIYALRNADHHIDLTADAESDDTFSIDLGPAVTADYPPGDYLWLAWAQRFEIETTTETDPETGEEIEVETETDTLAARHQVGTGTLRILPDLSLAAAYDPRTWAKRMLDAVEAVLEARASTDQLDLVDTTLGDRGMKRDRSSLIELRSQLQIEVQRETGQRPRVRRILARFV